MGCLRRPLWRVKKLPLSVPGAFRAFGGDLPFRAAPSRRNCRKCRKLHKAGGEFGDLEDLAGEVYQVGVLCQGGDDDSASDAPG